MATKSLYSVHQAKIGRKYSKLMSASNTQAFKSMLVCTQETSVSCQWFALYIITIMHEKIKKKKKTRKLHSAA